MTDPNLRDRMYSWLRQQEVPNDKAEHICGEFFTQAAKHKKKKGLRPCKLIYQVSSKKKVTLAVTASWEGDPIRALNDFLSSTKLEMADGHWEISDEGFLDNGWKRYFTYEYVAPDVAKQKRTVKKAIETMSKGEVAALLGQIEEMMKNTPSTQKG